MMVVMVGRCCGWWDLRFCGGALAGSVRLCGCVCVCVYQRKKMRTSSDLLKGDLVIAQLTPTDISKCAWTFGKMDLKSSKFGMRILFTSIKRNFFQKLRFILTKRYFWAGFFQNMTFGLKKLKQNGH